MLIFPSCFNSNNKFQVNGIVWDRRDCEEGVDTCKCELPENVTVDCDNIDDIVEILTDDYAHCVEGYREAYMLEVECTIEGVEHYV